MNALPIQTPRYALKNDKEILTPPSQVEFLTNYSPDPVPGASPAKGRAHPYSTNYPPIRPYKASPSVDMPQASSPTS